MNNWHEDGRAIGVIPREILKSKSGLEICRMMIARDLPAAPMSKAMNYSLIEADEGRVVFRGTPLEAHLNPAGAIHGGWAGTIMDSALGCAVWTRVPTGKSYSTVEFKVHLVRGITAETGEVVCEAKSVHAGKMIATAEATLKTADGKLLAHGSETCAIYEPRN